MTVDEFSNEFDTLLNSYSIALPTGITDPIALDEYEKSVYLTKSQEQIVIGLYTGKIDGDSFESTEEIRRYLSNLVQTFETNEKLTGYLGLSRTSMFFRIPKDVWFITYESATLEDERLECLNNTEAVIVPITQDDYYRTSKNPFRGPTKGRALRLDLKDEIVEIISDYNIDRYLIRYLAKPTPIILTDLANTSINGIKVKTECALDESIHKMILERAVRLAFETKAQYVNRDNK